MKPVVIRSVNDAAEQRCGDIRRHGDGTFEWLECRRDPEDPHGWRVLGGQGGHASEDEAMAAAGVATGWLTDAVLRSTKG